MSKPLHIAIAGLSTVGGGTLKLLHENAAMLELRSGRPLKVVAVSARDKTKQRTTAIEGVQWVDNALDLVKLPDVEIIVEAIGGAEGIAKSLIEAAFKAGKHVVSANKALIAHHGLELAQLAEKHKVVFAYEAAVAGGIPIIKTIREGLVANRFHHIAGVMNGTCNFILSAMSEQRKDFDWALKEAQRIGYAEADPSFDIDGIDTAHKITILTSLAYGCPVNFSGVSIEGIRNVTGLDVECAAELGYSIKLLGISTLTDKGVLQRVHPSLVSKLSGIGCLTDAYNGIIIKGHAVGRITLEGRGAGEEPTSSSMVGDIVDIARGASYKPFSIPAAAMKPLPALGMEHLKASYYVRVPLKDKSAGDAVLSHLKAKQISIQKSLPFADTTPQLILLTDETREPDMKAALKSIATLDGVEQAPQLIRMEAL